MLVVLIYGSNKGIMVFWKQKCVIGCGVSECDIRFIEERTGFILPNKYSDLMRLQNGGDVENNEFCYTNKISNNLEFGRVYMLNLFDVIKLYIDSPEFFPKGLIPFANDGGGNLTCFDYRKCKENPPIVFWVCGDPEGEDTHFVANNFEEFVNMLYKPDY